MSKFTSEKIDRLAKHGSRGVLLEVDVKYPNELHDPHNDLPFMCAKIVINKVKKLVREKIVINKVNKQVSNLYDKKNYVIHIRALD